MDAKKNKEVLVAFGDRKRPVSFEASPDPLREKQALEKEIRIVFKDVLNDRLTKLVILVKSEKWNGELVELHGDMVVEDNSIIHVNVDAKDCSLQVSI